MHTDDIICVRVGDAGRLWQGVPSARQDLPPSLVLARSMLKAGTGKIRGKEDYYFFIRAGRRKKEGGAFARGDSILRVLVVGVGQALSSMSA